MNSTESIELICSRSLWQVQWCILVKHAFQLKRSCHRRRQRLCSQVAHTPYNQNIGKVSETAYHPV